MQTRILKKTTIHILKDGHTRTERTLYYPQCKPWWSPWWFTMDYHYDIEDTKKDIIRFLGNKSVIKEYIKYPNYEHN